MPDNKDTKIRVGRGWARLGARFTDSQKNRVHIHLWLGLCRAENFPGRARPGQNLLSKKSARAETGQKKYGLGQKGPNFFGEYKPKCAQKIEKLTNVPNIY